MESIGQKIKAVRQGKHLTQKEFGDELGFSSVYISEAERGDREPSPRFLLVLKAVYDIDLTEKPSIVAEETAEYYTAEEKKYMDLLSRLFRSKKEGFKKAVKGILEDFEEIEAEEEAAAGEDIKARKRIG